MAKRKKAETPKVHLVPTRHPVPTEVPDCNRPLSDRGSNPGGLPPQGFKPGWVITSGFGVRLHTHS